MSLPLWCRPRKLRDDRRGLAVVEFGLTLPVLMLLGVTGVEQANWIITKMRLSQVALQVADNASRMGSPVQGVKTVSENDLSEVFTGGSLQAGTLNLAQNGRIILSSLEPMANPNTTDRYKIEWQRCYGTQAHASQYGVQGDTNLTGMGVAGRKVKAQDGDAVMFVEIFYQYTPLFSSAVAPGTTFDEIAAMTVRDPRKLGVVPTSAGTAATC